MNLFSFKSKFSLSLVCGLVTAASFRRLSAKYFNDLFSADIWYMLSYLILIIAILFPFFWQRKEKQQQFQGKTIQMVLEYLLLFSIALDLSMFGLQKLQKLQMIVPLGMLDSPLSDFSGEYLVWAFFRHSYGFTAVIALVQLLTAWLLLFARTRLLGAFLAIPLLGFIILMDFFYKLPWGVLLHGLILMTGVLYILVRDQKFIVQRLFSILPYPLEISSKALEVFLRILLIALPGFLCLRLVSPDRHPELTGKYHVDQLFIDGKSFMIESSRDSLLSHVYFDLDNELVFRFNDYRRQWIGTYEYQNGHFRIHWRYPDKTYPSFEGNLKQLHDTCYIEGSLGQEQYQLKLRRVR